jgi:hypothetical protein
MVSQQEKISVYSILRYPDLWLQCSLSLVHGLEVLVAHALPAVLNCVQNSLCTVITDLDTSKWSTQKAFAATPSWKLTLQPRSKHEKQTAGGARETWTVVAVDGVRFTCVRWEIDFLLTFETAPFFCEYPVHIAVSGSKMKVTWHKLRTDAFTRTDACCSCLQRWR